MAQKESKLISLVKVDTFGKCLDPENIVCDLKNPLK